MLFSVRYELLLYRRMLGLQRIKSLLFLGRGWGYVKTQLSCILFVMLTTTCFGHCGPSSGYKNIYRGKYTEYDHSISAYSKLSRLLIT